MKRSFDPAVLEMMDRPQPVSAELERDLERLRQLNRWFGSYRLVLGFMRRWIQPGARARERRRVPVRGRGQDRQVEARHDRPRKRSRL